MFRAKSANMAEIVAHEAEGALADTARSLARRFATRERVVAGSAQRFPVNETYFAARLPTPAGWVQALR